uniref:Uncharacterized protein n=1 Tax=Urocitellus parryii TaxID=9999 RepID=A0A8D2H2Q5_UROPR
MPAKRKVSSAKEEPQRRLPTQGGVTPRKAAGKDKSGAKTFKQKRKGGAQGKQAEVADQGAKETHRGEQDLRNDDAEENKAKSHCSYTMSYSGPSRGIFKKYF